MTELPLSRNAFRNLSVGLILFALFVFFLPFWFATRLPRFELSAPLLATWVIVLVSGWMLSLSVLTSQMGWIQVTFWLYVYTFLGITAFLQVGSSSYPWSGKYSSETTVLAAVLVLLGCVGFGLGTKFRRSRIVWNWLIHPFFQRPVHVNTAYVLAVIAIPASVTAIVFLGGFSELFVTRAQLQNLIATTAGGEGQANVQILSSALRVPTFAAAFVLGAVWLDRKRKNATTGAILPAATLILGLWTLLINNPLTTARYWLGSIVLGSVLLPLAPRRRNQLMLISGMIAGLVLLFPVADLYRNTLDVSLQGLIKEWSIQNTLVRSGNFDSFQQIENAIRLADDKGLMYGWNILGALLFWIPRPLWPGKPIATGDLIAEHAGYAYLNLSAPLWAEFYLAGGLVFVFLGFFIVGTIVRGFEEAATPKTNTRLSVASVFVPFLAAYQFFLLRGALISAFAYLVPVALCFLACSVRVSSVRVRQRRPGAFA